MRGGSVVSAIGRELERVRQLVLVELSGYGQVPAFCPKCGADVVADVVRDRYDGDQNRLLCSGCARFEHPLKQPAHVGRRGCLAYGGIQ